MKTCFIVCPIGSEGSNTRKRSDTLLKYIIEPVCKQCGLESIRVDNILNSDSITETIIKHIKNADLVIADLSEHNPNVFYEIGYRSSLEKPIIHLKSKSETIPFDISTIRTFDYDLQDLDLVDDLKQKLVQTINALNIDSETSNELADNDNNKNNHFNSQILQELFKIQDSVNLLHSKFTNLKSFDTTTISVLADKLANKPNKSSETVATEILIHTLLNDPDKISNLMLIADKISNK